VESELQLKYAIRPTNQKILIESCMHIINNDEMKFFITLIFRLPYIKHVAKLSRIMAPCYAFTNETKNVEWYHTARISVRGFDNSNRLNRWCW